MQPPATKGDISRVTVTWTSKIFTCPAPHSFVFPHNLARTFTLFCSSFPLPLLTRPSFFQSLPMSRPCRRLDAIFDTPSSPLAPPSAENANSSTTPAGSPPSRRISSAPVTPTNRSHSREASSSPYAAARNNRRNRLTSSRTTEDFTQVGVLAARKLKLKPESLLALEDFAKRRPLPKSACSLRCSRSRRCRRCSVPQLRCSPSPKNLIIK
ncbi:hypothetical protein B0H10DRAFT_2032149 [Mycena sp. CBHHK59/15]|nr:hypothetical protein B0H10DRAFT_2032149 [Mycena sp. CBHHK59/15]